MGLLHLGITEEKGRDTDNGISTFNFSEKIQGQNLRFSLFLFEFFLLSPFAELSLYVYTASVTNDNFCSKTS